MNLVIPILIIIITGIISLIGFSNKNFFYKLSLQPYSIVHKKQWWRIITHGFLHADWMHLIINMFVFYSFGTFCNEVFVQIWGIFGNTLFLILYLSAIVVSSIFSVIKHRNNFRYDAIGASGATSAITFTFILFCPWEKIYFFGILPIPAIIFGVIYLIYCYIMGKRSRDNIGHDAHFWGAVYGFLFPIIFKPQLILHFFNALMN